MEIYAIIIILLLIVVVLMLFLQRRTNDRINKQNAEALKQELLMGLKDNFNDISLSLNDNNVRMLKEFSEFKEKVDKSNSDNFVKVNEVLNHKLLEINKDMQAKLDKNFLKTDDAYQKMIERLVKIDEAQKKIENLSTNIVSLQDILSDKKSRGAFGEVQLNNILRSVFGEKQEQYQIQATLSNGTRVDALLNVPEPVGMIAIDSKFPLESYRTMMDDEVDIYGRNEAQKQFKKDIKAHIDAISDKYIIPNETTDGAIMFLPAEAVFAQIHANFSDIIDYANKKRVWLTSPTTLMATLTSIQVIVQNIEQSKYAKTIQEELYRLSDEFVRYANRWDKLSSHIDTVSKDAKDIHTTTQKITKRFEEISNVKFEEKEGGLIE